MVIGVLLGNITQSCAPNLLPLQRWQFSDGLPPKLRSGMTKIGDRRTTITAPEVRQLTCRSYGAWVYLRLQRNINMALLTQLFLAALLLVTPVPTHAQTSREYQVKSVFLFNFAQFTEWPPKAFPDPKGPFIIGLLGTDPFGKSLEDTVRDERARGRRIEIRHYRKVEEIKTCHILYISQSETARLGHILAVLKGKPVLTVSDIENAAIRGVMIRFITEHNRIRLRVNPEAVKAARLQLSSKLLRAAEIVGPDTK